MQKLIVLLSVLTSGLLAASCASTPPSPGDSGVLPLAEVSAFYEA